MKKVLLIATVVFSLTCLTNMSEAVQVQVKDVVVKQPTWDVAPYRIDDIKIDDSSVNFDTPVMVSAGDEWATKLSFDFTNLSAKSVRYLRIGLFIPPTEKTKPRGLAPFYLFASGSKAAKSAGTPDLRPGDKVRAEMPESFRQAFRDICARIGYASAADLSRLNIWVEMIEYTDGTAWNAGVYWTRDPQNKSQWVPLTDSSKTSFRGRTGIKPTHHNLPAYAKGFVGATSGRTQCPYPCGRPYRIQTYNCGEVYCYADVTVVVCNSEIQTHKSVNTVASCYDVVELHPCPGIFTDVAVPCGWWDDI